MGLLNKLKEPVFLKESSSAEIQLQKLKELEPKLNAEGKARIRQDIRNLEYGIAGEKNIAFELKNSHMPIYVLHDIYLEYGELSAQIDYLVFTKKICFVIECKNLYGDIEIDDIGNFIRTIEFGSKKKKEGIYSPITQNQRHLELMKKLKVENKENFIIKFVAEKYFKDFNKSIVVLANCKTVLNTKHAKKEVKDKVIRADQLVAYIKKQYVKSKEAESSDRMLLEWAEFYLKLHKDIDRDYISQYENYLMGDTEVKLNKEKVTLRKEKEFIQDTKLEYKDIEETKIFKELKEYRLLKSREEKVKPYFIYNNNQLKDLILKKPKTKNELKNMNGFGEVKVEKYGTDILRIISEWI